ncbi:LLM class flavin-dependent oxidoreductase [Mycolicibacterium sp. BiH015]|uniref:LLM class flavin-dependent oxidoreductase n=1 Tax=Mycolicibacterium sp. BiH015 TaxID=3018808 RepID=UPI0022E5DD5C|nr:LLM class flavin-dependent oxidoreductase [Mycolicibacterium sp. BiH015]MDA2893315.1 LLM class flavin-dependent oxidoreductase [Mycolicibacterium sp. BiH015]
MQFGLMVDLGRTTDAVSMQQNLDQVTELVKTADRVGFDVVVCGEHHGHEMTIAPAPFTLLTQWSHETSRVRLGTAVLCAPYWHPIRLAGEAALFDLISGGRLELGIGRGAYPYEFDRMAGGMPPEVARRQLGELLPALRGLWRGNYAHAGSFYSFPATTSTPRPLRPEGPPIWVSARHPEVFAMAVENRADLMVAPLSKGFEEVHSLMERRAAAISAVDNGFEPRIAVLRDTYVSPPGADLTEAASYMHRAEGYFSNLFRTDGDVRDGWVSWTEPATDGGDPLSTIIANQVLGDAAEVTAKVKNYAALGTDVYLYGGTWGLPFELELASIERFGEEVIAAFRRAPVGTRR